MRIIGWLKSWFGVSQVHRQLSSLESLICDLRKQKGKVEEELEGRLRNLSEIESRMREEVRYARESITRSVELNQKLEAALVVAADEVKTAKEITIPGLVAASQVLINRWEAETQVFAIRSALSSETVNRRLE